MEASSQVYLMLIFFPSEQMSNVDAGGATVFTHIGVKLFPIKVNTCTIN